MAPRLLPCRVRSERIVWFLPLRLFQHRLSLPLRGRGDIGAPP